MKKFKFAVLFMAICFSLIGCNDKTEVVIEQYKPTESERQLLNMSYKDMDIAQKIFLDQLIEKCNGMDTRVTKDINKDIYKLKLQKEEFKNTPPVKPDYNSIFHKTFKEPYIFFEEVEATNLDNECIISNYPNMLITEKLDGGGNGAYMLCYEGFAPMKDKNGIKIKENDKLKISRAEVTNLDLVGLPRLHVKSEDVEIIK